jgi:hypothetical protein
VSSPNWWNEKLSASYSSANIPDKVLEALSNVIVTATEGGCYTREDYRVWKDYAHGENADRGFRAAVTVFPHLDAFADGKDPQKEIRVNAEWLHEQISKLVVADIDRLLAGEKQELGHRFGQAVRILTGDEDVAGEWDVVDAGAILQTAVYGKVVFG